MLGSKMPYRVLQVFHMSNLMMSADFILPSDFDIPLIADHFGVYTEHDMS